MCPVDPVCHQLTCHRHLFSLSRTHNRHLIALFTPIQFVTSATPTSQRTFMCISMVCLTSVMEVCEILEFGFCGAVLRLSLHVRDDNMLEVCDSLLMMPPLVHHVPCCRLPQFSKTVELHYWV